MFILWVCAVMHNAAEYVILHTHKEIPGTNSPSGIAEWEHNVISTSIVKLPPKRRNQLMFLPPLYELVYSSRLTNRIWILFSHLIV